MDDYFFGTFFNVYDKEFSRNGIDKLTFDGNFIVNHIEEPFLWNLSIEYYFNGFDREVENYNIIYYFSSSKKRVMYWMNYIREKYEL